MPRPSPTVRRRRLRYELRRLRTERGLTIEDVQERSNSDIKAPTLSRWETGERSIRPVDLRLLLDIYEIPTDEREALLSVGHPFFAPRAGRNRIGVLLTGDPDWAEIGELVIDSYRILAPKKLIALLG